MIVRGLASLALALAVTLGLFFLMDSLIELGKLKLDESDAMRVVDFVRLKRGSDLRMKKRELPQKKKIQNQPSPPKLNLPTTARAGGGQAVQLSAPPPAVDSAVKLSGGLQLSSAVRDASSMPLVRINPMYPRAAAAKRLEGWVLLEFDISTTGGVINARVIKAKPPNVFNKSALDAIRKWKYKPMIVDGKAVVTRGVQVKLTFQLDK